MLHFTVSIENSTQNLLNIDFALLTAMSLEMHNPFYKTDLAPSLIYNKQELREHIESPFMTA